MTVGWSNERISATVNQTYIEKELGSKKHQDTLHQVLAFGDGLTDDTYLDWILERSPRFFLILNDIGVPEKIFEVIDRSFDDDDLPLSQDALYELNLFGTTSETLDKKFYRQQFYFQIQELEPGGHVDYGSWDIVPVEATVKKPGITSSTPSTDRVFTQEHLYTRKKIPTSGETGIDRIRFIMHLKNIAAIQHRHLVTVWATYSQDDCNFVLLTPSCDVTLKHILEDKEQAKPFKCLEKHERRQILLTWIHCLTSGLAYLHSRGFVHKSIRPSTIGIDHNNVIYLNDYNAIRVLDVDESPNPYSGEIYDYAPPENWQRKPCLHETAPLKTYLPGGGRTSRRLPKSPSLPSDSRRPSLTGQDNVSRTHSRSQNSSSGSSTNPRPRNALITTFAPPDTTPASLPNKHYPGDVFSLTTVLLTLLSYVLGHSPKSFASHRSRLNRQAGRGNAPPDASFHKNLKQVEKWIDTMAKEAGQKEKKDNKLWGAIVELINLCKEGIHKDPEDRISADDLEQKIHGWVDWGIGRRRKCSCSKEDRALSEPVQPNRVLTAQRDSILSWSKISERISEGLEGDSTPSTPAVRPRRSLSQRLSLDRNPELRRSRHQRPTRPISSISGQSPSLEDTPATSPPSRRQSEVIRTAVKQAVATTSPQQQHRHRSNSDGSKVIHQGRSAYRIKPKKAHTIPTAATRRISNPIQQPIIREEEPDPEDGEAHAFQEPLPDKALKFLGQNASILPEAESAYSLAPRKQYQKPTPTSSRARSFPRVPPQRPIRERPTLVPNPSSSSSSSDEDDDASYFTAQGFGGQANGHNARHNNHNHTIIHGIPLSTPQSEDEEEGFDAKTSTTSMRAGYRTSYDMESEVWGLGTALEEEGDGRPVIDGLQGVHMPQHNGMLFGGGGGAQSKLAREKREEAKREWESLGAEARRGRIGSIGEKMRKVGGVEKEMEKEMKREREREIANEKDRGLDWPLPLGTLTFDGGVI